MLLRLVLAEDTTDAGHDEETVMGRLDNVTTIPRSAVVALLDELEAKGRTVSIHWSPPADVPTEADRLDATRLAELQRSNLKGANRSHATKLR